MKRVTHFCLYPQGLVEGQFITKPVKTRDQEQMNMNMTMWSKRAIFPVILFILFGLLSCNTRKNEVQKFEGTVSSLSQYEAPEWFRNAKFGIYVHWGVYSVAEQGEWYPRMMYIQGSAAYKHHLKTWGHPSEFGYKDFIPLWKAEKFDPDKLVRLFKKAGARYFAPCAVHHDNFDLWDSKYHRWNAVNMGPKKDLIGMWRQAALKNGLRFGVTTHLARAYSWMNVANQSDKEGPLAGVPYDGDNPEYDDFYFKKHSDISSAGPENPPKAWRDEWANRMKDLIEHYHPDHFYFDGAIPFRGDMGKTGMDVIAYLYNHSMETHNGKQEAVMCIKERPFTGFYVHEMTTLDFERGKAPDIRDMPWQTDDTIGPWGYHEGAQYRSTDVIIDELVDIVSKNGNLLLNVPMKADGTLDEKATTILEEIGEWMSINGEGIYDTRPWYDFGEGKINTVAEMARLSQYTDQDIRYTTKDHVLYAFVMAWPGAGKQVRFKLITPYNAMIKPIKKVTMLGVGDVSWEENGSGLYVTMPDKKPYDYAYGFKMEY